MSKDCGSARDIFSKNREGKGSLYLSSKLKLISRKTKLSNFNSNVKSILLYGSETWRAIKATSRKIQTFVNECLRKILRVYWPDTISSQVKKNYTSKEDAVIGCVRLCANKTPTPPSRP